jgi:hypothetical protein
MNFIPLQRWAGISVPYPVDLGLICFLDPDPDNYYFLLGLKKSKKKV